MEEKILKILGEVNKELLTYTGDNMLKDGLLDSFELIDMIGDLEDAFDIDIDAAYVVEKYVGNKDRIIALIKMLKE